MAKAPSHGTGARQDLRRILLIAGLLLGALSAVFYIHAIWDGDPVFLESLRPRAAAVDPLAVTWIPTIGGFLIAFGAATRLRFAWAGLAVLAIFGVYFFFRVGWPYLLVAGLLAAVASQIPPRRRAPRPALTSS